MFEHGPDRPWGEPGIGEGPGGRGRGWNAGGERCAGHGPGRGARLHHGEGPRHGRGPWTHAHGIGGQPGGPFGGPFGGAFRGRGRMARRGDVRLVILELLAEQPMHGYQVIQELEARSGGRWRPSAGSVYPTLQQLEDEGLVRSEERDGRRVFTLTDAGRAELDRRGPATRPWEAEAGEDEAFELRDLSFEVVAAAMQVGRVGGQAAVSQAREILVDARRRLYRLLAEDDTQAGGSGEPASGSEG